MPNSWQPPSLTHYSILRYHNPAPPPAAVYETLTNILGSSSCALEIRKRTLLPGASHEKGANILGIYRSDHGCHDGKELRCCAFENALVSLVLFDDIQVLRWRSARFDAVSNRNSVLGIAIRPSFYS